MFTYLLAEFRLHQSFFAVQTQHGVFDTSEQGATPSDRTGIRRLILVHRWIEFVTLKNAVDLGDLECRKKDVVVSLSRVRESYFVVVLT